MNKFTYVTRIEVLAAQWTGHNLEEMKELLQDVVESNEWDGPEVYSEYIEPFFIHFVGGDKAEESGYNMLKFYAWGDDQEVDPGMWVVVYSDGEGEVMDDEQFTKMGFKK